MIETVLFGIYGNNFNTEKDSYWELGSFTVYNSSDMFTILEDSSVNNGQSSRDELYIEMKNFQVYDNIGRLFVSELNKNFTNSGVSSTCFSNSDTAISDDIFWFNNVEIRGNNGHNYLMQFMYHRMRFDSLTFSDNICIESGNVTDIITDTFDGGCIKFEDCSVIMHDNSALIFK